MQNRLYIIVFLLLVGFTAQAQITDEPIDGGGGTTRYYYDGDNDNYGNPNSNWLSSPANGYVPNNTDCNDNDAGINPTTRWYRDVDGDGRGRTSPYVIQCIQPSGYVRYNDDIDDTNNLITHITPQTFYRDADGDGFGNPAVTTYRSVRPSGYVISNSDCNDSNASINPNLVWYRDADADGWGNKNITRIQCTKPSGYVSNDDDINDSASLITNIAPRNFYKDADGDGYGSPAAVDKVYASVQPTGYVTNNQDCWDSDAAINPNTVWYQDSDNDGFGTSGTTFTGCDRPLGYVPNNTDCDDSNGNIHPNTTWYKDGDRDGFAVSTTIGCSNPGADYTYNEIPITDCDDNNNRVHPNTKWYKDSDGDGFAISTIIGCNSPGIDYSYNSMPVSDCDDGDITLNPNTTWYLDGDGDGFAVSTTNQCTSPGTGYTRTVLPITDCNDGDLTLHPNTVWYLDADNDGFAVSTTNQCTSPGTGYTRTVLPITDCNDGDLELHPNTIWYFDADGDGFLGSTKTQCTSPGAGYTRSIEIALDCNDNNPNINNATNWYADLDGDGYGDPNAASIQQCLQPNGYVLNNTDQCPNDASLQQGCPSTSDELGLSNENYVFSRSFQNEMSSSNQIDAREDVIESVTYFDGLGRAKQQIAIQAAPNQNDIVTHMEYDALGRQAKSYLPFSRNTPAGSYKAVNVINDINTYYKSTYPDDFIGVNANSTDFNAYSESVFENSPLNRVVKQGAPGKDWKANHNNDTDHTIKFDWKSNTAEEVVRFDVNFKYNNTEIPELIKSENNYAANELYVTITKDENWKPTDGNNHTTREYKDKQGRVVLKRTYAATNTVASEAHDTYYVYDRFGNLTFVIPPKVTVADGVSDEELAELCYQYKYDKRNRLIIKKIPGKGEEYIVYNNLDQPVLTQDANQRKVNSGKPYDYWLLTKYDAHGRVAYTGRIANSANRNILQSRTQSASYKQYESKSTTPFTVYGVDVHYTKAAYPTSIQNIYTMNYYDTYEFDIVGLIHPGTVYGTAISDRTRSLPTGTKVRVLDTDDWITTVMYYDSKGRPIYVASKNEYLNTIDIVETKLDFAGKILETKTTHTKGSNAPIVTIDTFTYDHVGRLLTQVQKINDQTAEQIDSNTYDALGQLIKKNVGGAVPSTEATRSAGLQTVDYTYNVRGWLQQINNPGNLGNDLFAFGINYNTTTENLNAEKLYNGNISETIWKTANDNTKRAYGYQYDALNRIKSGISKDGNYNLSTISYDKMGNIMSLDRKGHINEGATSFGNMDVLSYTYDAGNRLLKVADAGNDIYGFKDGTNTNDDFDYDVNGNMILDRNKGITEITYNHLNLPNTVAISNSEGTGNISYIYDATGVKQKKIVTEGGSLTATEYAGNYVYKSGNLEFFNHPEGYVEPTVSSSGVERYDYVYQYKDHLRNIRLSYKDANKDGSITQDEINEESNYYPFGLQHEGYNVVVSGREHQWDFQGQEYIEDFGLNVHEWKYRTSDPATGRFWQIDPLAEDYMYNGTYNFAENRVIDSAELEGLERIYAADGKFINQVGDSQEIRVMNGAGSNTQAQNLISIANNTELPSEERAKAASTLNDNSYKGHKTTDDAAKSFVSIYNNASISMDVEAGAVIHKLRLSNGDDTPVEGTDINGAISIVGAVEWGSKEGTIRFVDSDKAGGPEVKAFGSKIKLVMPGVLSGFVHTHGRGDNDFSGYGMGMFGGDKEVSKAKGIPIYMANKERQFKVFEYNEKGPNRQETLSNFFR